jgi:hypothetical protein
MGIGSWLDAGWLMVDPQGKLRDVYEKCGGWVALHFRKETENAESASCRICGEVLLED